MTRPEELRRGRRKIEGTPGTPAAPLPAVVSEVSNSISKLEINYFKTVSFVTPVLFFIF